MQINELFILRIYERLHICIIIQILKNIINNHYIAPTWIMGINNLKAC